MSDPVVPPNSSSPDLDSPSRPPPPSANPASQTTPDLPAAASTPPPSTIRNADTMHELIAPPFSVPTSPPSKTPPPPQEPLVESISPPAPPPLTPAQSPEKVPPPPTNVSPQQSSSEPNVESPSPPPPSTSQPEPPVTSPSQTSSEPNVESPAPPPPSTSQPEPLLTSPPQTSSEPNVESPAPPPPPTSQAEPPVTSPPHNSSKPNVESPAPPPPSTSQPMTSPPQRSSDPNVESSAPPPPSTSQPEPPVTSPPQSSSDSNVESSAPPPPPSSTSQPEPPVTSPPQISSDPNVESFAQPPPSTTQPEPLVTSPPQSSSDPNVESSAPPPPSTSQPEPPVASPPPQDTTPSSDVVNKASISPPDSTKTSSPSEKPPQPPPSPPLLQEAAEPSTDVTPPRSSTSNEITNAETPNQPDQKPTDHQAEQEDPNKENTSSSISETVRNVLKLLHLKKKKEQSDQSAAKDGSNKGESTSSRSYRSRRQDNEVHLQKMKTKLDHMQRDLKKLHDFEDKLGDSMKQLEDRVRGMIEANKSSSSKPPSRRKVDRANRDIKMLSVNIPSSHKLSLAKPSSQDSLRKSDRADATLPNLHLNETFLLSSEFKEYQQLYNQLDEKHKLCLLCFAVFPKHEVIKKRLMMHWWLGEGFLDCSSTRTEEGSPDQSDKEVEDLAEEIFKKLMHVGFIQPVYKKRRQEVNSFKMHPVVHSAVVILAKSDGFFEYDSDGNPTKDSKLCARACLLQPEVSSDVEEEQEWDLPLDKVKELDPENLETLFNISKIILDFNLEWFSKMKKLNVLYLGRWQASPYKHHIEVESSEFLDGFKNLKRLRFLSLQGISRIFELPKLLRHLTNLRILDLRACHNLEVLPKEIGMLKRLTHLDISECYLLDRVPKEVALLTELQVLKGFVICCLYNEKACTLEQLTALANLRKLSITTNKKTFPSRDDLNALKSLQKLTHLRIVWGHDFRASHSDKARANEEASCTDQPHLNQEVKPNMGESGGFLDNLKKLDLQSFPEKRTPTWLMPCNVMNLEKLYIKGGELEQLCPIPKGSKWNKVEVLCLKFLSNLKIEWKDLQASFPELYYLEKARCPNLNVYPCDEDGIWVKSEKKRVATSI